MNTTKLFAVAALAALTSVGAFAGEADYAEHNTPVAVSARSAQDVRAEAVLAVKNFSNIPTGSRVAPAVNSKVDRAALRAETVQAVRLGHISYGEAGVTL